jgi:hypothetical protein
VYTPVTEINNCDIKDESDAKLECLFSHRTENPVRRCEKYSWTRGFFETIVRGWGVGYTCNGLWYIKNQFIGRNFLVVRYSSLWNRYEYFS